MRIALLLLAVVPTTACITPLASSIPGVRGELAPAIGSGLIDLDASELRVTGAPLAHRDLAPQIRKDIADGLNHLLAGERRQPARFRVTGGLETYTWPMYFPCLIVLAPMGCPMGYVSADVTVDLEVGARRYRAPGANTVVSGYFYNTPDFAHAVVRATADAVRKIAANPRAYVRNKP